MQDLKRQVRITFGLHLSREIFRMHQGTVRVLESDETGTTFQILLPIFTAKDAGSNLTEL